MDVEPLKDAFWEIVVDCLHQFHGYVRAAAWAAALDLRRGIERPTCPPIGYQSDLFYHEEPFYVACDLAGRELALDEHAAVYDQLMRERYVDGEHLALASQAGRAARAW